MRYLALALALIAGQVSAADLYYGAQIFHLSHLDVGPPFNDDPEDSVDHVGLFIENRWSYTEGTEWTIGLSVGTNTNLTGCSGCWDDGGALFDTALYLRVSTHLVRF